MLCLFIFGANGQENIRENHIKLKNDSSRILFDKVCMPFNKTDLLLPNPNAKDVETAIDNTNFKADRPFYIPLYYINPTPMFYGDYSTSGHIFSHFYGSGSQTTLPGIGRINEASIMFHHQFNNDFETRLGINATKYNFPKSTGQAFGIYGAMIYHPNERLRLKVFGVYTPTYQYGFYRNTYGITAGYDFTDRLEMEVGIQNYYNPEKGWNVAPIVIPRYIIRKTKCFDFWERNVLFPKTKRSFFRTPTPLPCPFPLNFSLLIITKKFGNLAKNRYICIV